MFKKDNIILFVIIIITLFTCNKYRVELNRADLRALNYSDSISYYKLKNGALIASKNVLEYNSKEMKNVLNSSSSKDVREIQKKFNKIENKTTITSTIKIDSISVKNDTSGFYKNEFYSFYYKSSKDSFKIKDFNLIKDTFTLITGYKRNWFLGPKTKVIDIHHSNPLIRDSSIQSFQLKETKKWYQTTVFKIGIGVVGGIILYKNLD